METARILEYLLAFDDVALKFMAAHLEQDATKKAELGKAAIDGALKPFYGRLEKYLDENGTGYLVGNQVGQFSPHNTVDA